MKKRTLIFTLICAVVAFSLTLCACSDEKKFEKQLGYVENAVSEAKSIATETVITDGTTVVYKRTDDIAIDGEDVSVNVTESKLSSSFVLEDSTSVKTMKKSDLKNPVNITKENVSYYNLTDKGFTCAVSRDKVVEVFGAEGLTTGGDTIITCEFDGKKLTTVTCEYGTESGKRVTTVFTFGY